MFTPFPADEDTELAFGGEIEWHSDGKRLLFEHAYGWLGTDDWHLIVVEDRKGNRYAVEARSAPCGAPCYCGAQVRLVHPFGLLPA